MTRLVMIAWIIGICESVGATGLLFSGFAGGSDTDTGVAVASDGTGFTYVAGRSRSADFPVKNGFQPANAGGVDAFVAKIDPDGNLVWSTYLGASANDEARAIAVDAAGNLYVAGITRSVDFPIVGGVQDKSGGAYDGFLAKIDAAGTGLLYSTYLGGSGDDSIDAIAVDSVGDIFCGGNTSSMDFPILNPVQMSFGGVRDIFVSKIKGDGSGLLYATYVGGSGDDQISGMALDTVGRIAVAGDTTSIDFPVVNAIQGTYAGGFIDGVVFRLGAAGNSIEFATYLGGSSDDETAGIGVDAIGNLAVAGSTASSDFPVVKPIKDVQEGFESFIAKLDPSGTQLLFSTYFGGSTYDDTFAMTLEPAGDIVLVGVTDSATDFPLVNPVQPAYGGGGADAFIARLSGDGSAIRFSTFLGGTRTDWPYGIAANAAHDAYVCGTTWSNDFPVINAFQPNFVGILPQSDGFVAKLSTTCSAAPSEVQGVAAVKSALATDVELSWSSGSGDAYDVWRTTDKAEIPNARTPGNPPIVLPVTNCAPTATETCVDQGAASGPGGEVFFYQVRGLCKGTEGL